MSKFGKVAAKKLMVKFVDLNGEQNIWTTCSSAVKNYASKNFKEGEEVKVTYNETPDGELKYHVTKIEKGKGEDTKSGKETINNSSKPTCKDCGKELKDDRYEKCYTCNKKKPSSSGSYGKTPEVQESIKRQAIGHMVSRTIIALTGQVDVNTVHGVAEALYKTYQKLVG